MHTQALRTVRTFRLNDAELVVIREAAAEAGLAWTTFTRRAALAAARRRLAPATVEVGGEAVPLLDTLEVP